MSNKLSQELVSAALMDAVGRQSPLEGLIHHSDRGRQYASYAYQALLERYSIRQSMSRSSHCHDNHTLSRSLARSQGSGSMRGGMEARLSIFEYVEVFYARQRRHAALGYRNPDQYQKLLGVAQSSVHFFGARSDANARASAKLAFEVRLETYPIL